MLVERLFSACKFFLLKLLPFARRVKEDREKEESSSSRDPTSTADSARLQVAELGHGGQASSFFFLFYILFNSIRRKANFCQLRRNSACSQVAEFGATGSIVECTVPEGATAAAIEACGAQGGGGTRYEWSVGGRGARVVCRAAVRPGERLVVLVGQVGGTAQLSGGGGGGSFVVRA
eukprot:COSAG04_NODE_3892_length_2444_cov_4.701493_1_plen_176_part_10